MMPVVLRKDDTATLDVDLEGQRFWANAEVRARVVSIDGDRVTLELEVSRMRVEETSR